MVIGPSIRARAPFLCGFGAAFLLAEASLWFQTRSLTVTVLIEATVFFSVGLLSNAVAPARPARSALLSVVGVVVGVLADVVVHPTLNGGERNLFPFELAFHVLIAAPSLALAALISRSGR